MCENCSMTLTIARLSGRQKQLGYKPSMTPILLCQNAPEGGSEDFQNYSSIAGRDLWPLCAHKFNPSGNNLNEHAALHLFIRFSIMCLMYITIQSSRCATLSTLVWSMSLPFLFSPQVARKEKETLSLTLFAAVVATVWCVSTAGRPRRSARARGRCVIMISVPGRLL